MVLLLAGLMAVKTQLCFAGTLYCMRPDRLIWTIQASSLIHNFFVNLCKLAHGWRLQASSISSALRSGIVSAYFIHVVVIPSWRRPVAPNCAWSRHLLCPQVHSQSPPLPAPVHPSPHIPSTRKRPTAERHYPSISVIRYSLQAGIAVRRGVYLFISQGYSTPRPTPTLISPKSVAFCNASFSTALVVAVNRMSPSCIV